MSDTALSSAAIKLLFETGDIPTQQNFADAWSSYPNLIDNNQLDGMALNITAHAGGGQGSATALTNRLNVVTTCATNGNSVRLPVSLAGRICIVFNYTTHFMDVFPSSGETIQNFAANGALSSPPLSYLIFTSVEDGAWFMTNQWIQERVKMTYLAKLVQSGTAAPVATIIYSNMVGNPTWSYEDVGSYKLTNTGIFVPENTVVTYGLASDTGYSASVFNPGEIFLNRFFLTGIYSNDIINNDTIQVDVYL